MVNQKDFTFADSLGKFISYNLLLTDWTHCGETRSVSILDIHPATRNPKNKTPEIRHNLESPLMAGMVHTPVFSIDFLVCKSIILV